MQILERKGWEMNCPFCDESILYTLINNVDVPVPFFYAEDSNDVMMRRSDLDQVEALFEGVAPTKPGLAELEDLWHKIIGGLPSTIGGGNYTFWSNVKCPSCGKEMPYNGGVRNVWQRVYEPKVVCIDGARLIGDDESSTWRIAVQTN